MVEGIGARRKYTRRKNYGGYYYASSQRRWANDAGGLYGVALPLIVANGAKSAHPRDIVKAGATAHENDKPTRRCWTP